MQVPHFELFWTDGYLLRRTDNARNFTPPTAISLLSSSGLTFSITAPRRQIEALHVRIANVLSSNSSTLISIEFRCATRLLVSQTCTLQQARRRGSIELDLRGTTLEAGRRYDVVIRPIDRRRAADRSFLFLIRSCAIKAYWTVGIASMHLTRMFSRPSRKAYRRSLKAGVLWPPLGRAESRRGCSIAIPTASTTAGGLSISENLVGVRSQSARLDLFASRRRANRQRMGVIVLPHLEFYAEPFLTWLREHASHIAWTMMPVSEMDAQVQVLVEVDIVVFVQPPWLQDPNQRLPGCELRAGDLLWSLHLAGVTTVLAEASPGMASDASRAAATDPVRRTPLSHQAQPGAHYHAHLHGSADGNISISSADPTLLPAESRGPLDLAALIARVSERFWPRVAVIVMVEGADTNCSSILSQLEDQSYCGEINSYLSGPEPHEDVVVADVVTIVPADPLNGGNAACWSIASRIQADLYIFLDANGTVDRDFAAAHVSAHWFDAVDVAIGSTCAAQPDAEGADLNPAKSSTGDRGDLDLPDTMQRDAFVNLASGNVSIKRRCLAPAHELPRPVGSGFSRFSSWIDFGLYLYDRGAQFVFAPDAVLTRRAVPAGGAKRDVSAGGLNTLLRARPEIGRVAGRWLTCQADRLLHEANHATEQERSEVDALRQAIKMQLDQMVPLVHVCRGASRRLRILSYRWHVAHQYEIYKLPHDFTLVTRLGLGLSDSWDFRARPLPDNVRLAKAAGIDPRDFDAAILHFDESVLSPELTNGVVPAEWGAPLRWFLENVDLPKVAICHGTPPFVGQWGANPDPIESFVVYEDGPAEVGGGVPRRRGHRQLLAGSTRVGLREVPGHLARLRPPAVSASNPRSRHHFTRRRLQTSTLSRSARFRKGCKPSPAGHRHLRI